MKKHLQNLSTFLSLVLLLSVIALAEESANAEISPRSKVQETLNELVKITTALPGENNRKERRDQLYKVISPRFDFREMAKRSLGAQWKKCNDAEREEFVDIFSDLLAKTYLNKIENIRSDTVRITGEKIKEPKALVYTMITYEGDEFPVDYKLMHRENSWMVYDVIIENIGLVNNYRTEFSGIIRREKFSGLMKRLREKTT